MKSASLLLLSVLLAGTFCAQEKNVLFVGNSYVFTNDLPFVLNQIAGSNGDVLNYDSNALAGLTLQSHTTNAQTLSKIEQGGWDHVIFQEQSQLPAMQIETVETQVFPYAEDLANYSRTFNECVMPVFYMTWGRESGDEENCADWPPVCTFDGMQDLLTQRYRQMAQDNECWTAPVGEAWRTARELDDDFELYAPDGSHPNEAGTYLTACVFYATIWGESPVGTDYVGGLSQADASFLQNVAATVVLGQEDMWNLVPLVWADLDIAPGVPFYTVTLDLSYWTDSALVEFEAFTATWLDGAINAIEFEDGWTVYQMTLYSECGEVSFADSVFIGTVGVEGIASRRFSLYPNPVNSRMTISGLEGNGQYHLFDLQGRMISTGVLKEGADQWIDVDYLPAGSYLLSIRDENNNVSTSKFLKE
jgi:hypothetical protein